MQLILTNSQTLSKIQREVCDIYVNDNHHATVDVEDAEEIFWWWIFKTRKSQSFRKSKGYMYIVFILRALLIFYTRIQYLWYTQSIYFYFIFFLSLCFIFLHYSSVKLFSSFRPVLECTNFSITWCSRQKRVLTICFISRTQVLIEEHTFMELWSALQTLNIISFSSDWWFHAKFNFRKICPKINCSIVRCYVCFVSS